MFTSVARNSQNVNIFIRIIYYKLLRPQLDLVAWFARGSCKLELQSARSDQRPKLLNTQGPIRLRHTCHVAVAAPSMQAGSQRPSRLLQPATQPAGMVSTPQQKCSYRHKVLEKCHYFRNNDPYSIARIFWWGALSTYDGQTLWQSVYVMPQVSSFPRQR